MHKLWIQCGKPRSGIIDTTRLRAKYDYKQIIRKAADDFEKLHADEISEHLLNKESKQFWRACTAKKSFKLYTDLSIDGKSNSKDIATAFRGFYAHIYVNSGDDVNALNEYLNLIDICSSSNETLPDLNVDTIEKCN